MIDRKIFLPHPSLDIPDICVPLEVGVTVPTERMAYLLADLCGTNGDVLELGTGSGYQTAVLAERCNFVFSMEINLLLLLAAASKLPGNVALIQGDACTYDTGDQFDAILVCFGVRHLRAIWAAQLRDGGRLVVPLIPGARKLARISVYTKEELTGALVLAEVPAWAMFTEEIKEA